MNITQVNILDKVNINELGMRQKLEWERNGSCWQILDQE